MFLVLWALFFFVIGIEMVPNGDMEPRLSAGDIIVYSRINKTANIQDVVVIDKNDTRYIGRVVAKGGDTVEITEEENLVVNGNMVVEGNIFYSTPMYEGFVDYPVTLKDDEYFVLSDFREGGEDSRYYGPVKRSEIKGTVIASLRRNGF